MGHHHLFWLRKLSSKYSPGNILFGDYVFHIVSSNSPLVIFNDPSVGAVMRLPISRNTLFVYSLDYTVATGI